MDRVSFKLVAFAFLAFMLCTATTPVVGRATKSSTEELALAMEYKMIPEKMATSRVEPSIHQTNLGNQKTKMMNSQRIVDVLESYMKKDLQYGVGEFGGSLVLLVVSWVVLGWRRIMGLVAWVLELVVFSSVGGVGGSKSSSVGGVGGFAGVEEGFWWFCGFGVVGLGGGCGWRGF
uniref:Transmembrane protein n=1 Tax=Chenopodium quinoa TaxID=63459 RepID=A0A803LNS9_CHEQI